MLLPFKAYELASQGGSVIEGKTKQAEFEASQNYTMRPLSQK